ncbi:MAG: response regulator, partial [Planctomycetes bacterium]|nr:response regulator [Planctomycetota bacterium]
ARPGRALLGRATADGAVVEEVAATALDRALAGAAERAADADAPATGPETVLAVPLRVRGEVFAVLVLARRAPGGSFPPADVAVAETLASRAAVALENARLYHELQQADRQKNEFLSMLAHELRNPLAPIRNANEVLHQKGHEPARVRWAQGVIDRQLTHLVRLVDDLLDVSRLTLGKIRLTVEPVELDAVLAQAVEAVRPMIDQYRHHLEVALPARPVLVSGDPARLIQVFANLLNNAAKYTDPGGRIWVAVSAGREIEGGGGPGAPCAAFAEVRVRDTGVGIAPEALSSVFELFIQANRSLDRAQGGLGVGLTLVRRLVEMHGGSVEAHSEGPGRGSEFVVRLPIASDPAAGADAPAELPAFEGTADPLRVVVVDDNVDGVETLADLIGLLGHEVRTAHDGPAGLAAVGEFDPDLVLLDIGLPGMDGYEVARRLRGANTRAVLVAVSGYGRDEDRAMSREAGFEQHFVKPVEYDTLRTILSAVRAARVRSS